MKKYYIVILGCFLAGCGLVGSENEEEGQVYTRPTFPAVGEYFYADWGPDDRLAVIYMQLNENGGHNHETRGLYTIRTDGSDRQLVVLNSEIGARILNPTWSPDGEWIAFSAGGEIFKVRPDGSDLSRLTFEGEAKFGPAWSPDGQWIAYRVIYGTGEGRGLWVISADGETMRQLNIPSPEERCPGCDIINPSWAVRNGPSWSSGGNELAYITSERNLAVYDTSAARVDFKHKAPATLYNPQFSPDGSRILFFMKAVSGHGLRVGVIDRDGGNLHWLREHAVEPSWSPDGSRIVYRLFSYRDGQFGEPGYGDLWIMNADGSNNFQLTFSTGEKK